MFDKAFLTLCISAFVVAIGIGIITPILPLYANNLGASGLGIGFIHGSLFLSMVICNPFIGRLSDRIGKKIFIVSGFFGGIFLSLSYVYANGPIELIIVRLFHGIIAAMVMPVVMAYIGGLSAKGQEGVYMGIYNAMLLLGGCVGPVIGGKIADLWGMDYTFFSFAVSMIFCFILTLFFLPRKEKDQNSVTSESPVRQIFFSRPLKGLLVFGFTLATAQSGLLVFMPLLASGFHLTNTQIGTLASCFIFTAGIFQVPFGWLANRFNRVKLVIAGTLLMALGLVWLPFAEGFFLLLCIGSALGLASAIASPAANAMVVEHGREIGIGFVSGTMNTFNSLGMIIGPVAAGIAMDQIDLSSAFHLYAVIFVIGTGLFYYFTRGIPGSTTIERVSCKK